MTTNGKNSNLIPEGKGYKAKSGKATSTKANTKGASVKYQTSCRRSENWTFNLLEERGRKHFKDS